MENNNAAKIARNLLESQKRAVLATANDDGAYASLMSYAPLDSGRQLLFATEKNTRKYRNLQSQKRIALLIDNRSEVGDDTGDIVTVTAIGPAREAASDENTQLHKHLLARHPDLGDFLEKETCTIMILEPDNYRIFGNFQTQNELKATVSAADFPRRQT
ncbi:MAG: pyridoxamine 5'-phosphate oxidase family protein [Candidatus Brocadiia bacterium]